MDTLLLQQWTSQTKLSNVAEMDASHETAVRLSPQVFGKRYPKESNIDHKLRLGKNVTCKELSESLDELLEGSGGKRYVEVVKREPNVSRTLRLGMTEVLEEFVQVLQGFDSKCNVEVVSEGSKVDHKTLDELLKELDEMCEGTQEMLVKTPRYRRRSSVHFDAVHDVRQANDERAPAQLYSTVSGRLFHAGAIVIVLVGPPARGKTHISVSLTRYLQWLGVKTRVYHLGDYRRATLGVGVPAPSDYFHKDPTPETALLRQRILKRCREDIFRFLNNEKGQVAIYDAVNPHHLDRQAIFTEFSRNECQVVFLESLVNDMELLNENVRNVKLSHPDFDNMDREAATALYLQRLDKAIPHFETLKYKDGLPWIKVIDAGKRVEMNDKGFTFIHKRIVLYLMNLHNKSKKIFFARAGKSSAEGPDLYRSDDDLSPEGRHYAKLLTQSLIEHRKEEHAAHCNAMDCQEKMKPLTVWTSQRVRTIETVQFFGEAGHTVLQRTQLAQLNPGQLEKMTDEELDKEYPGEREKHELDPYHHRWPRAESYHDVAVRMEPIIFELEREQQDILIIAHETVLRVLYGYCMARSASEIPELIFPRNQIVEIVSGSYKNEARRIPIIGLPTEDLPIGSPGALDIPVCTSPSGSSTPMSSNASPVFGATATPKPSLVAETLKKVQAQKLARMSVEGAVLGAEYFPVIDEGSGEEGDDEKEPNEEPFVLPKNELGERDEEEENMKEDEDLKRVAEALEKSIN